MKILVLSDEPAPRLWNYFKRENLEGIDLILSCGDLSGEYLSFLTCFTHAPILYVYGNHDGNYDVKPPEGCICIEDSIYTFNGVRILGLGGSMRYRRDAKPMTMYSEKEMQRRIRRLRFKLWRKKGFDILLAHAPAYGVGDDTDRAHTGFAAFLKLIERYQPKYFVHGHVHKNYTGGAFQRQRQLGSTTVVNAWQDYIIEI